ncbi:hypothetical protein Esti_002736 [Eimeria stiedai]
MGQAEAQWRELSARNPLIAGSTAAPSGPQLAVTACRYLLHFICLALTTIQEAFPGVWRYVDALLLTLVDVFRLGSGLIPASNLSACKRPIKHLILYEFEPSPWCRRVREVLSVLRIDYISHPCPRESLAVLGYCKDSRFRNELKAKGKRLQFPYLDDPNTGTQLYESGCIIEYLWKEYGAEAKAPLNYQVATFLPVEIATHLLACCCRPLMSFGMLRAPSKKPEAPLELFGCEASPCARRVREALCCLELPYVVHVSGKPGTGRVSSDAKKHGGSLFTPMCQALGVSLWDPNTKMELSQMSEIVSYLRDTYELEPAPAASWLEYGTSREKPSESKMT